MSRLTYGVGRTPVSSRTGKMFAKKWPWRSYWVIIHDRRILSNRCICDNDCESTGLLKVETTGVSTLPDFSISSTGAQLRLTSALSVEYCFMRFYTYYSFSARITWSYGWGVRIVRASVYMRRATWAAVQMLHAELVRFDTVYMGRMCPKCVRIIFWFLFIKKKFVMLITATISREKY